MQITETPIDGLIVLEPKVFHDERGYFLETYNANTFSLPYAHPFVQDNEALSAEGILRGMHFQKGPSAQGKLVRVIKGSVYDVGIDIRENSPTYLQWFGIVLSAENKKQLWLPRGFAHGYLSLEPDTIFAYKCDNFYDKAAEGSIRYDDPRIGIEWPSVSVPYTLSPKDLDIPFII